MDKNALKEFLQRKYENPDAFLENVIFPVFGEENYDSSGNYHYLHKHPEDIHAAESAGIVDILALGSLYVEGSQLDIFDITVSSKSQLANSRVGIQQLIRRIISTHSGAFMIFHYKTSDRWDWRFTFCHKGANALDSTDSKRYTFLLGPGQSCRTAAENFCKLGNKIATDGEFEMEDIIKAFDVEALSKEFFDKYKAQYEKFVNYMADPANGMREDFIDTDFNHDGLTDEQINSREEKPLRDYVKKLLGRIVFLHFIQKKGWLGVPADKEWGEGDLDFMMNLFNKATDAQKDNFLDEILEPLFEMALNTDRSNNNDLYDTKVVGLPNNGVLKIPYLNGGLFEREDADEPDSVFPADYFNGLLTFLSQYNFTIDENDPNDAQVGIDPEMLGRIFENLLEDNKDKGAFYTPKEIVQYMCKESLISYLQNDTDEANKDVIRNFVSSYNVNILDEALRNEVDAKLKNVKICDPAIGSGAFPMGLLKEIFYCRGAIENFDEAAEIKKEIIQNNIYGVDIEKGAVDIARLRFWLSIIVDEKTPHCLPNMDFKIMQGNSLIEDYRGIDLSGIADGSGRKQKKGLEGQLSLMFDEKDVLENLHDQINGYYKLTDHVKKNEARDAINELVRTYIKKYTMDDPAISEEIDALPFPNDKFFLWHTYFADVFKNGGFDIVIGNPPYIDSETMVKVMLEARAKYANIYDCAQGNWDIFVVFIERAIQLCNNNGVYSYIIPNKLIAAKYAEAIRNKLSRTNIFEIRDYSRIPVFSNASVYPCTIIGSLLGGFQNAKFTTMSGIESVESTNDVSQAFFSSCQYWDVFFKKPEIVSIIRSCLLHKKLANLDGIEIAGAATVGEAYEIKPVISDQQNVLDAFKMVNTGTIDPYVLLWGVSPMQYIKVKYQYPCVSRLDLEKISKGRVRQSSSPKIIVAGMSKTIEAAFDNGEFLAGKSTTVILAQQPDELKFILALLNSQLMSFITSTIFSSIKMAGGFLNFGTRELGSAPIPDVNQELRTAIIRYVDEILAIKGVDIHADITAQIEAIDSLVYKAYNISQAEREAISLAIL